MITKHIGIESELGCLHVLNLDRARNADTGIIDQNVDPASNFSLCCRNRFRNLIVEQNVEPQYPDIQTFVARQLLQFIRFGPRRIAHGSEDRGAGTGKQFARPPAEAGRGPGNQDCLPGQIRKGV